MTRRIYISGPMTGLENHNFAAFHEAEERWARMGWVVFNPARNFGGRTDLPRKEYMRLDFHHVMSSDALAMLPGWQGSPGALSELNVAQELGLEIFDAVTMLPLAAGVTLKGWVAQ